MQLNTRPATPDAYKVELPKDFVAPEGVAVQFKADDPAIVQARAVMHDIDMGKLSGQEAFSKLLSVYAASKIGEQQEIVTARAAELNKLGATGVARQSSATTWLDSMGAPKLAEVVKNYPVAAIIGEVETLIKRMTSQGAGSFSTAHREAAPAANTIPGYEKMNFMQRRAAQDQLAQRQNGAQR